MARIRTRWISWLIGVAVIAAIAWSFVPQPVSVEVAQVSRGPLIVTLDEEAKTRVRERYTVSAPVTGYLTRIAYRPGAAVRGGQTVASLLPAPPTPIDARTRLQLQARGEAAVDSLRQARARVESAGIAVTQANREFDRHRQLAADRIITQQEVEASQTRQRVADAELKVAAAGVEIAQHDVDAARAALSSADRATSVGRTIHVKAPRDGDVLRVFEESERVVPAGTPLLEIGASSALEIVVDLLSTDAVRVSSGTRVLIDRWGGEGTLNGIVCLVEPSSFTKVSALGVEEQRVNVVIEFTDPPTTWQRLGDGFALEVRLVVFERSDVLKVPTNSLFRQGDGWAAFTIDGMRAAARHVRIGRQNGLEAEVIDGLSAGNIVVVHPSERVVDGVRVTVR